ncbi:sugar transporter domain-containing protein [Ditylenchus destructor]|uniref:Sugar transporter domain-containing protein n=1 Tax=Ditylenchus destructor TaxID=166010 RepID=A0AAD4NCD4_9BILA|nr:sugar transporter domain-containing protein [Ditylenchus destructor]
MMMGVMVQFGTVIGSVFAMPQMLCRSIDWWLIYGAECSLLLIVLSILPFLHESPGTLVTRGQDMSARKSIQFFHNCSSTEQIEESLKEIKTNMKLNAKSVSMLKIWKEKGPNRRGTAVGCVVAFAMAFSGIAVINAFAVEIFRNTGMSLFHASLANVSLSVISLISCIISSCVIDRFGRRRLLLMTTSSILLLNVSIFTLMFCHQIYKYDWISVMLIIVIALFIFAFSTGPGPLCFFMTSEMVSQNARSAGQSWATLVQMTSRTILLTAFLPLKNAIGAAFAYLVLFVAPILFSVTFFYFALPETKNRNMHEIEEEFRKLPKPKHLIKRIMGKSNNKHHVFIAEKHELPMFANSLMKSVQ